MTGSGQSMDAGGEPRTSVAVKIAAVLGGMGCLSAPLLMAGGVIVIIVIGGLGVLLFPLIVLILLFSGHGHESAPDVKAMTSSVQGDGTGELVEAAVPEDLLEPIQDAGGICPEITPVVIAAQLEVASGYKTDKVSETGEEGISQLNREVFKRLGRDGDGDGEISALDPADSIATQGIYMCELADRLRPLAAEGDPERSVLSLALAAYKVGPEQVREAGAVPASAEAQQYVVSVRIQFPKYLGVVPPLPSGAPSLGSVGQQ
ncbi:lytic transglycosylase domain-containing protein [Streptomyces sp. WAC 01325]|uniref:transglycosylase SLT domain-containing protein n=1 Tax=Streptomyces sp. WAC 01325 TaxID=2203202 RepID=UPI000F88B411|nr:transglycosylase SLT domain-containing protein [Streptomyces sp. WAC 01325]RSM96376.1 lytic transglycosylase domain-containing protein [Streptomyces sp. WAC 01325]